MKTSTRTLTGALTSAIWTGVGAYMAVYPTSLEWRLIGLAVVAVGIFRAAVAVREWRRGRDDSRPAPDSDKEDGSEG